MNDFNASHQWHEKATALHDPIAEFNARGGQDFNDTPENGSGEIRLGYKTHVEYQKTHFPDLGDKQWKEIKTQLPKIETIEDPETGQRLRAQLFNWPTDEKELKDKNIAVLNQQYSVSLDIDHVQYQNYELAKALDSPMVVFENPGFGESDKLTDVQIETLKEGNGFVEVAKPMLGILKSLGVNEVDNIGYSMGADIAAAMAANAKDYGISVNSLFVFESPGVEKQNLAILGKNFFAGGKDLSFAWHNPYDPVLSKTKLELAWPYLPYGLVKYGRALSKGTLLRDVKRAAETQPDMKLTIGSAGSSTISPKAGNFSVYSDLKELYPDRVRRIIIPGESHQVRDSALRFANITKLVLKNSVSKDQES